MVDLKIELIYWSATTFATRAAAEAALFRYIDGWYNPRRIQAGPNGLSPDEYEQAWKASQTHPQPATSNQIPPIPDSSLRETGGTLPS